MDREINPSVPFREIAPGIRMRRYGNRLHFQVPYKDEFVVKAHTLQSRWKPRSACWSFPRYNYGKVLEVINEVYGTTLKVGHDY